MPSNLLVTKFVHSDHHKDPPLHPPCSLLSSFLVHLKNSYFVRVFYLQVCLCITCMLGALED